MGCCRRVGTGCFEKEQSARNHTPHNLGLGVERMARSGAGGNRTFEIMEAMSKIITFTRKPWEHKEKCWKRHVHVVIDSVQQTLECGECGATLSAFKVLTEWANAQWTAEYKHSEQAKALEVVKADCERLFAEIRLSVQGATHHHARRLETLTRKYANIVGIKKLEGKG